MNIVKFALGLGFVGLATVYAQVNYIGNTADNTNPALVTTVIDLGSDPTGLYGGSYDASTKTWTWLAAETNVLQEFIVITNGTLNIEPGSIVRGQPHSAPYRDLAPPAGLDDEYDTGALLIARGAKLIAAGTSSAPIVFTTASVNPHLANWGKGFRASGSTPAFWDADPINSPRSPAVAGVWGGLLVLGNAPQNADRNTATLLQDYFDITGNNTAATDDRFPIEGGPGLGNSASFGGYDRFGGFEVSDNSGVLSHLSIRHGGAFYHSSSRTDGLTLGGVGSGTTIDHVEIWGNANDGVGIFGGTVNLQNILIVGVQDDGLAVDQGYTGTVQFLAVIASTNPQSATDKLGEWDGSHQNETYQGVINPTVSGDNFPAQFQVANATFVGVNSAISSLHIRDQASPRLVNSIIVNGGPIEVDNRAGITNPTTTNTTARFTQEASYLKGVTFSGAFNTNTGWVASGSADATIEAKIAEAKFENIFNGAVGFVNVPTGTLPANLEFDPRPTGDANASFDDLIVAGNASYKVVPYRGAFDPNDTTLWTAEWSAADAYGLIIK